MIIFILVAVWLLGAVMLSNLYGSTLKVDAGWIIFWPVWFLLILSFTIISFVVKIITTILGYLALAWLIVMAFTALILIKLLKKADK